MFDQRAIDAFLARLFANGARTSDFRWLRSKLFVAATIDQGGLPLVLAQTFRAKQICEAAYRKTRQRLLAQHRMLRPLLARHGIRLAVERVAEPRPSITAALTDPRSLSMRSPSMGRAIRDLSYALEQLEYWLAGTPRVA